MRPGIGRAIGTAMVVLAGIAAMPVNAQETRARGIGVPIERQPPTPPPAAAQPQAGKQVVQVLQDPGSSLTTQDCVNMPTAVETTDCLNQVSNAGQYMPAPQPAPGSQMPMTYRLPLGTRALNAPR